MKKKIKGGLKKTTDVVSNNKLLTFICILIISIIVTYIFREDIILFFVSFWGNLKKNWFLLPLTVLGYKLLVIAIINLGKRFAINKSTERIKKMLFHSEIDELFGFIMSIYSTNIKNATLVKKIMGYIPIFLVSGYAAWKLWLFTLLKVINAQFWTGMLLAIVTFIQNIPGLMTWLSVIVWLWLETYFPWITRSYDWMAKWFRYILDPVWDNFLAPIGNWLLDIIVKIEFVIIYPFGYVIDWLEISFISFMKGQILKYKGFKEYRRIMRLVKYLNNKQSKARVKKKHEHKRKLIAMKKKNKYKILALKKKQADK